MAKRSVKAKDPAADSKAIAALDFEGVLTKQEMEGVERAAQDKNHGITRRVGLAMMLKSKRELVEGFGADGESAAALFKIEENLRDYIAHLKAVVATMESAHARAWIVLEAINREKPHLEIPDAA